MIRYYRRGPAITAAETDATADRLEREGWQPISTELHRALWRRRDRADLARIAVEDWRQPTQTAPLKAEPVKVVYPAGYQGHIH